jgi:hypothetical protein
MDTYQRWNSRPIGFFPVGPRDMAVYQNLRFTHLVSIGG